MQSKQYELCRAVLGRLHKAGLLKDLVLIGSWCLPLYRDYFRGVGNLNTVKTRDIDILVPSSARFRTKIDIPDLLSDLGFIIGFRGDKGLMFLQHPELMIEFLVSERERGSNIKNLSALGVNAQPLRFMDVALRETLQTRFGDVPVTVPHPVAFVLHKLLVAPRRKNAAKRQKDLDSALSVLRLLRKKGDIRHVQAFIAGLPRSWQKQLSATLQQASLEEWAQLFRQDSRAGKSG